MSPDDAATHLEAAGSTGWGPGEVASAVRSGGESFELRIPVRADLLVLARLGVATVASRAGFGFDDVEDLRLAVEELCLSVMGGSTVGVLCVRVARDEEGIIAECELEPDTRGAPPVAVPGSTDEIVDDLSLRIVGALVDEHGRDTVDGRPRAWLRKFGGRVEP